MREGAEGVVDLATVLVPAQGRALVPEPGRELALGPLEVVLELGPDLALPFASPTTR